MGRAGKRRAFRDDRELAEVATFGVCAMLELEEPYLAAVVQPVASAAWALALEGRGADELRREATRARQRLRRACRASAAIAFLDAVIAHTRSRARA